MLITNGTLITWETPNRILENHAIYIEQDRIREIGPTQTLLAKYPQEERLDAKGQYVMPGNICAHTHFYGAFARGLAIPGPAPADFPEILEKLWWSLDKSLSHEAVYYSALVCLVDAIRHGTTTLIDHHASPNAIAGSLDDIARAVEESGVRASLCYEVTDRDGPERAQAGIEENLRFIDYVKRERPLNGRLAAMFGLHASLTLSEATLQTCRERVGDEEIGFHIHVAEHPVDEYDSLHKYGERVVDRLHRHGILGPKSIVVHAVHVDVREINLLAETGTWVTHQPRSNMNNAVGMAMTESMLRAGVKVGLGNDGFSNAMWEEWKAAYLAHKLWHLDPRRMPATDIVKMAIYNNATLATQQFNCGPIGVITPGAQADLIFVDYHPFTPITPDNLPWHIVFGFHESMVTTTMVAGKVLMRDRELLTLDVEKITYEARQLAPRIWERYQTLF
ncbi:putative aminohydrolase SsnA [uncultured Thermanaerothrix sp.]|uniref:putative aminohydrolase SsnA n=1 Tax=uncultured Thermanaerothrix sp. TaxID=1195149 RepID=UPI002605174B|nr:putative aminohydrolase SsnA [uncultured Thermanaerothrix sp.]